MPNQPSRNIYKRGDVVLVPFPNSNLKTGKMRPALIVQSDEIDSELSQIILAMISSNLKRAGRQSRVLIDTETADGRKSGLLFDSVVMAENLATILNTQVIRAIGVMALI